MLSSLILFLFDSGFSPLPSFRISSLTKCIKLSKYKVTSDSTSIQLYRWSVYSLTSESLKVTGWTSLRPRGFERQGTERVLCPENLDRGDQVVVET